MAVTNENKLRVLKIGGGSSTMGLIEPIVNMVTNWGTITAIASGAYTITVSGAGVDPNEQKIVYPHQVFVTEAHATGVWSYPSGDGSVKFGRTGIWPSGVPVLPQSGGYVHIGTDGGNDVMTYYR